MAKSYFSKVANFYRSSHRRCSVKKCILEKVFAKFNGKHLCQRLYFNKVAGLKAVKQRLAQVFSCEFIEISKNTFITEDLRTTGSAFSFSEKLGKNVFLKISQSSQENTCDLRNFQEHLFYGTPMNDCFWLFPSTLLKWGTANSVWETSDEYSLSRNTSLSSVLVYHFFFIISFSMKKCMFSLVYTVYCQKQPPD